MFDRLIKITVIKSAIITTVICAVIHILILLFYAFTTGKWEVMNMFQILHLQLFNPNITRGLDKFITSYLFLAVIFLIVYLNLQKSSKKKSK